MVNPKGQIRVLMWFFECLDHSTHWFEKNDFGKFFKGQKELVFKSVKHDETCTKQILGNMGVSDFRGIGMMYLARIWSYFGGWVDESCQ